MYKMLIFDLDGTAIPNRADGEPSQNLIDLIKKLQKNLRVCLATGRPFHNSIPIIRKLGFKDPCIISGGTQILDPVAEKIIWEKDMDRSQVEEIMSIASAYSYPVYFSDDKVSTLSNYKKITGPERIIYIEDIGEKDTEIILGKLSHIKNITAHKVISWTLDRFDIHVTHSGATKKHALEEIFRMLKITKKEVVAAGDSENDLPLFEQAAYKIAMENGSSKLKEKADIIAKSSTEDGLAIALDKLLADYQN